MSKKEEIIERIMKKPVNDRFLRFSDHALDRNYVNPTKRSVPIRQPRVVLVRWHPDKVITSDTFIQYWGFRVEGFHRASMVVAGEMLARITGSKRTFMGVFLLIPTRSGRKIPEPGVYSLVWSLSFGYGLGPDGSIALIGYLNRVPEKLESVKPEGVLPEPERLIELVDQEFQGFGKTPSKTVQAIKAIFAHPLVSISEIRRNAKWKDFDDRTK